MTNATTPANQFRRAAVALGGTARAALMPRNRTRAERLAAGLVAVEVALSPEDRNAIDAEARELGLSRAGLVSKWAKSLAKRQARRASRTARNGLFDSMMGSK